MAKFYFSKTPGVLIPKECIALLPFRAVAMSAWEDDGRLQEYLVRLCDRDGSMIDESGTRVEVNYSFYADYIHSLGLERVAKYIERFNDSCKNSAEDCHCDLEDSLLFGQMMQSEIAWAGSMSAILSEGGFFSLAHILESEADLQSSLEMAQRAFYRQAILVLRCFLEEIFVQLHFCNAPEDYSLWKAEDYRIPPFRGKRGLMKMLQSEGILSRDVADTAADVYGELNGAIHGAQRELLYAGVSEGKRIGPTFTVGRFERWCALFSRCVDVGLRALHEHLTLWEEKRPPDSEFCSTCHETDFFDYTERRVAGKLLVRRTCRRCGTNLDFFKGSDPEDGFYEVTIEPSADKT